MTLCSLAAGAQTTRISLNTADGTLWQIKPQADVQGSGLEISKPGYRMDDYVKGVVPGIVFVAYVEAGLEKDPNFGGNIWEVDETFYNRPFWYRTEFEIPASYRPGQRVWLHFDNTNRFADFYFNGHKISGTPISTKDVSGHMIRTKYDVTELINPGGKNSVAVLITDADQKKTRDAKDPYGVKVSPSYLAGAGWDWMPYVPGRLAGITGPAYVRITGDVVMEDPWVRSELPALDRAELSVSSRLLNSSSAPRRATVSGIIRPGNIKFAKEVTIPANDSVEVMFDKNEFKNMVVRNPRLWWPNGYGDPNLYTCDLSVTVGGKVSDEKKVTFGIKKYEYGAFDNVKGMPVMTFFINGKKVFLKGGNWGMSEYLLRGDRDQHETKIRLHKDMNYNMIRLWTGCVTDEDFYDMCDKYGIMVWDDFWLYVAYNQVEQPEAFLDNARDKVRRLRNHPSIALWCGANETRPEPRLDTALRRIVAEEDHNDRRYKSCSNQDSLSGSGWWGNQPPRHHFQTSASNLAFNKPPYPYGVNFGYGLRSEIGTATFPVYESVIKFIPQEEQWPLPSDEVLKNGDKGSWNRHFFGKEASNANPANYKKAVNQQYGESSGLEEFCEKAQLINIEVMKGMYEAWNDKMWNDATGILIWMSASAYPSLVWQTYDYYYDPSGAYWGAKKACEPLHVQWNSASNSIKAINTTSSDLNDATVTAKVYDMNGKEMAQFGKSAKVNVPASNVAEAFIMSFNPGNLAFGKKAVSSSQSDNMPASMAVDGGAGSRWAAGATDNEWIYVDMGKKETIERVVLSWEAAYGKTYEIQVSDDANIWKTVYSVTDGHGGTENLRFQPVDARYVRMKGNKRGTQYPYSLYEFEIYAPRENDSELTSFHFMRLELRDSRGKLISDNFYWRNGEKELDYTPANTIPEADLSCTLVGRSIKEGQGRIEVRVKNNSNTVAFANRLRLVNRATRERVLPIFMNDNYVTLLPGEEKVITFEAGIDLLGGGVDLLVKQYGKPERRKLSVEF